MFKIITVTKKFNRISRRSIQRLDLLLLVLETIDLRSGESLFIISKQLKLSEVLPSKVSIWKLRNNNPMRKSYIDNKIKLEEFEALTKITVEMSKYLYPYIRDILQSRDDYDKNPAIWDDFKNRFVELINERFNTSSMRVNMLLNPNLNDEIIVRSLLCLALCNSYKGFQKLRTYLLYF